MAATMTSNDVPLAIVPANPMYESDDRGASTPLIGSASAVEGVGQVEGSGHHWISRLVGSRGNGR